MKAFRLICILALTLILAVVSAQPALAFPPLPSSFFGTVKINGANVPLGTVISAKINGVQYGSTTVLLYQGITVYSLDVLGEDTDVPGIQGGSEGDTIVFFIGSIQANQTGIWHSGTNINLNLTGSGVVPTYFFTFLALVRR
jgi:hypothetical protein